MEDKRITAEQLVAEMQDDLRALAEEIAVAMNAAKAGRIIADSEEPVRDAHAEFRQRAYERALCLLQDKQEAFSPSAGRTEEQGPAGDNASDDQRANPPA